jgi:hypothetical protein
MKSKLHYSLTILFAFLLLSCNKKNDISDLNLKGNINTITSIKYNAVEKFGKPETTSRAKRNEFLEEAIEENSKMTFSSDKDLEELILYNREGETRQIVKTVNDTIAEVYTQDGDLISRFITENKEYPALTTVYNFNGDVIQKTISKYNPDNLVIEEFDYDEDGNLVKKVTYEYDNKDRVSLKKYSISERYERHQEVQVKYEYDKEDDIKSAKYDSNGESVLFEYKYEKDKEGNWIKRIDYINNRIAFIVQREIIYN